MNITKLDLNYIELFAEAYSQAEYLFDVAPEKASAKVQKKIWKWVNKACIVREGLPRKVSRFIEELNTPEEGIRFITECAAYIKEQGTWKRQLLDKAIGDFPEDVQKAFVYLVETMGCCDAVEKQDGKILFTLDDEVAYKRKLVLHTSVENNTPNYDFFSFNDAQILKEENGYKLICIAENFEEEMEVPIGIFFDSATTEVFIYRADQREFTDNPWTTLCLMAMDILEKRNLGDGYLSGKERDLMPLLKELSALLSWDTLREESCFTFENLKTYVKKYNLDRLLPLFDKVEKGNEGQLTRLNSLLNEAACRELWRELYVLVADTQEGYEDPVLSCDQERIKEIRSQLEESFHKLGYEGQYPNFRKNGEMKGLHLEENYNLSYFVGAEKNVTYMVHCIEATNCNALHIQFVCGTAFLKKGETIEDIYDCCFNQKGRRLFKTVYWDTDETNLANEFAVIAAKRAECIKLSKKEKENIGNPVVSWTFLLSMFLFTGGLFAIMMTAATFLILCLVDAILFGFSDIPNMIAQMPWWLFFAISFVGFGGAMTIVDAKARTK